MFRFIRNLLTSVSSGSVQQPLRRLIRMESDHDMLDLLAFNCSNLTAKLQSITSAEEQSHLIAEYIAKADALHKPINDFKEDLDWFNVTEPLSFKSQLRGKVVILDFFTYCCINCLHILPDLKRLEQLYTVDDGLVVVGVHSAKFDNEKDSSNILSAVQRNGIAHPVVNDCTMSMWEDLQIKCWPTMVILGPRANPLFVLMGEGNYETLEKFVGATIKFYNKSGELKTHSLPLNPAVDLIVSAQLQFPSKIVCSHVSSEQPGDEMYAIADTGYHRIIITSASGAVLHKIGGKSSGFIDGDFVTARFNGPQGLCFLNSEAQVVFVADTENHAIRRIDLKAQTVVTIAGTGRQGTDAVGGLIGTEQEISSPWDVAVCRTRDMDMSFHVDEKQIPEKDILLVAAAGLHQIWAVFLDDVIWWKFKKYAAGSVVAIAGNGREENRNNSYPTNAAFAQPSGLSLRRDTKELFIADSESSAIRKLQLQDGKVVGVAGGDINPRNLFAYGDVDGKQFSAKLQHPLGVAFNAVDNCLFVADTYNHKVKRIDVATNMCSTCYLKSDSDHSSVDSEPPHKFNEPGGLCLSPSGDRLLVADTNNHRIVAVDLTTMMAQPWRLFFNATEVTDGSANSFVGPVIKSDRPLRLDGGLGRLNVQLAFPAEADLKFTADAPQKWTAAFTSSATRTTGTSSGRLDPASGIVELDIETVEADSVEPQFATLMFRLNLCSSSVCFQRSFAIEFPVQIGSDGDSVDGAVVGGHQVKAILQPNSVAVELVYQK